MRTAAAGAAHLGVSAQTVWRWYHRVWITGARYHDRDTCVFVPPETVPLLCDGRLLNPGTASSSLDGCDPAMQNPLPEQVQFGGPVPYTLDELHPADLPFTLPRTPGRGEGGVDRLDVLTKAMNHGLKGWDSGGLGVVKPLMEGLHILLSQQGLKPLLQLIALGEQRMDVQEAFETFALGVRQATGGLED